MSHANSFKRLVVKNCILIRKYDSVSNDIYMLTWRGFFWLHNFSQGPEFSFVILEKKKTTQNNHAEIRFCVFVYDAIN